MPEKLNLIYPLVDEEPGLQTAGYPGEASDFNRLAL
jgi:hypothetical protein